MKLSKDYILGLIEGEGYFGNDKRKNGKIIPCFTLKMHARDKELLSYVKRTLGLDDYKIYEYNHQGRHFVMLIVRDLYSLKTKIVPFFKGNLCGFKGKQFSAWLKKFPYLDSLLYRDFGRFKEDYYKNYAKDFPVSRL